MLSIQLIISQTFCFEFIQSHSKSNSVPGLNRGLSSDFWQLKSTNHEKFAEECVVCMQKHVLVKKKKKEECLQIG